MAVVVPKTRIISIERYPWSQENRLGEEQDKKRETQALQDKNRKPRQRKVKSCQTCCMPEQASCKLEPSKKTKQSHRYKPNQIFYESGPKSPEKPLSEIHKPVEQDNANKTEMLDIDKSKYWFAGIESTEPWDVYMANDCGYSNIKKMQPKIGENGRLCYVFDPSNYEPYYEVLRNWKVTNPRMLQHFYECMEGELFYKCLKKPFSGTKARELYYYRCLICGEDLKTFKTFKTHINRHLKFRP